MTVALDPTTQQITDNMAAATAANAPGAGSVGGAPTSAQPAAPAPDTSASDALGNIPLNPRGGGVSPGLSEQIAQNLQSFPVTADPSSWSRSLMAASWQALA